MKHYKVILKEAERFAQNNSPQILTAVAVGGVVTTAVLTGKASFKAAQILEQEHILAAAQGHDPSLKVDVEKVWKLYVPAAGVGALTIASVVMSHKISHRRAAAMATVYALSERAFDEYREKVKEQLGAKKEQTLRDEIAQDRVTNNPASSQVIIGSGDVLMMDSISGRYFNSSVETVRKAMNDLNNQIINEMYASLYEWWALIGLPPTNFSTEVGWDTSHMLEVDFSTALAEDGKPCVVLDYRVFPTREYGKLH